MNYQIYCNKCGKDVPYTKHSYEYIVNWRKVYKRCEACSDEMIEELQLESFVLCPKCKRQFNKQFAEFIKD